MKKKEPKSHPVMYFCPLCGGKLAEYKGHQEEESTRRTMRCSKAHVWEVGRGYIYSDSLDFRPLPSANCARCGQSTLVREMRELFNDQPVKQRGEQPRLACQKCYRAEQDAWRMDPKESFAQLEVIPVRTSEGLRYHLNSEVAIRPYPNPLSWGGSWGGDVAHTKKDLRAKIAEFRKQFETYYKVHGMERIEVVTRPETVRVEQKKLAIDPTLPTPREKPRNAV